MTPPAMDPRIRARRTAVMRAKGRRRLRWLLAALVLVAFAAGGWWATRTELLDVDHIEVAGPRPDQAHEVLQAAGLRRGQAMIDVNPGEAAERIEALAWVESAEIRRSWPSAVQVSVVERVPVAVVPAGDGAVGLVDAYGFVISRHPQPGARAGQTEPPLSPGGAQPGDLPLIDVAYNGPLAGVHSAAGPGLSVVAAMTDDLRPWITAVTVAEDRSVGLELYGGAVVSLGDTVGLDDKMASLRSTLAGIDLRCAVVVDVSMADTPTVRRHPRCLL